MDWTTLNVRDAFTDGDEVYIPAPGGTYLRLSVEEDGTVHMWDSVAGGWTLCHSVPSSIQRRARQLVLGEVVS